MSNIAKAFAHGKAFIQFITCGDPDLETTAEIVRAMARAGADLIELGIPFSDPTAEGPVIQAANVRALAAGTTTDKIFDLVRQLRKDVTVPMVFMTYANVVFSYGSEKFISTCREVGIDGLILPDVPYEEKDEFDVVLDSIGDKKIQVIKEVRALTSLGLKEAKELVDGAPKPVLEGANKEAAEKAKEQLEGAGATVTLK